MFCGLLTIFKTPFIWVAIGGFLLVWCLPRLWAFLSEVFKRG